MSYFVSRRSGRPLSDYPGMFPGFPGGLPGPVPGPDSPGFIGPVLGPAASLFPTNVKWGDVVSVMGPFAGKFQGQVVVRFEGAPPMSVAMQGPYGGSVIVPDGAQTGACTIELDGRQVFGTNCVVTPTVGGPKPREHTDIESWKHDPAVPAYLRGVGDVEISPRTIMIGIGVAALVALAWRGRRHERFEEEAYRAYERRARRAYERRARRR